jgi:hypothetical protein
LGLKHFFEAHGLGTELDLVLMLIASGAMLVLHWHRDPRSRQIIKRHAQAVAVFQQAEFQAVDDANKAKAQ